MGRGWAWFVFKQKKLNDVNEIGPEVVIEPAWARTKRREGEK